MKKIMLSAAVLAALIGTATAATTVTSANTVGYQEISLVTGFNMITPTFLNTGATDATYDIQDIKLSDVDGNYGNNGTEQIQILDADGNVSDTYVWLNDSVTGVGDKWCDGDLNPVENVTIQPGTGFLLAVEGEGTVKAPMAIAK